MSTPFNDQWILHRTDPGRGTAYAPAGESAQPDGRVAREGLRTHGRRERSRTARTTTGLYKRPKWIDRDT